MLPSNDNKRLDQYLVSLGKEEIVVFALSIPEAIILGREGLREFIADLTDYTILAAKKLEHHEEVVF